MIQVSSAKLPSATSRLLENVNLPEPLQTLSGTSRVWLSRETLHRASGIWGDSAMRSRVGCSRPHRVAMRPGLISWPDLPHEDGNASRANRADPPPAMRQLSARQYTVRHLRIALPQMGKKAQSKREMDRFGDGQCFPGPMSMLIVPQLARHHRSTPRKRATVRPCSQSDANKKAPNRGLRTP